MCELFVATAAEPFVVEELWPFTERLERLGIAGYGWGAAWRTAEGSLASHRDVRAFCHDADGRSKVAKVRTSSLLVHLRRPSRLSTQTLADTQPFVDPEGGFAFAHNGDFRDYRPLRKRLLAEGRIAGRADSEVGARWLEDHWTTELPAELLAQLHRTLGGQANLALLEPDGALHVYAGNAENPVFAFDLGPISIVSTGIYSLDRSIFRLVAPEARRRSLVRVGTVRTFAGDRLAAGSVSH